MSHGLRVYRADGGLQFDSSGVQDQAILLLDLIALSSGQSANRSYPEATGRTISVLPGIAPDGRNALSTPTVTYPSGVPTVSIDASPFLQEFLVMVQ